jgi:class 3 adenylate cyclase/TolB-like protein
MSDVTKDRGDLAALNADVVGYSRLLADDYEGTTAAMTTYKQLVDAEVTARSGTVANFVGDSFMAVFGEVENAVGAAIAITTAVEARNAGLPESRSIRFRMGLDQGDVGFAAGGYHGDALNIAARIQAIARPGGISVSGRVYRSLDEPALRFRPVGRQSLKNIPEHIEVYELADLPTDGSHAPRSRSLSLEAPTLAVLPVHADEVDDRVRRAAGVIRQDLLHRLSVVPQLNVVDAGIDPQAAQGGATARYMLESGVHQFGEHVRVYVTLFDVTTMNVVKSHKWSTGIDEMIGLSDQVAEETARAVQVELIVGEPAGLYAELDDPEAIEQVYLGWYHMRSDNVQGWTQALDLFGRVAESHPEQPYGHVLSAFALWLGVANGWVADPAEGLEDARRRAGVGVALGDPTGMAHAVEAAVLMLEGKPDAALAILDTVEIIRPTCDVTYALQGSLRRYLGQWQRAVELLDVAMRLTGINKPWYPTVKASSLFVGGKLEEAVAIAEAVLEHQPNNLEALLVLAAAQSELGMGRRARATAQLIEERFPSVDVEAWLDNSPYQRREIVERWKGDLASVGAIG